MSMLEATSRWSLTAKCPRAGALALRGAEPAEPSELTLRYFARGKQIGAYVVQQLREKYGPEQVVAEKALMWAAGIGHADAFVTTDGLTVEVKSRMTLAATDDDLLQLAGYMRFDPESRRGALMLVNPSDLGERVLPVLLTDSLREQVDARVEAVVGSAKSGALPDCVCETPSQCRSKFCPFTDTAWEDWVAPQPRQVGGEIGALAAELLRAEQEATRGAGLVEEAKVRRDELRAELRHLLEPGVEYEASGIRLRRTVIKPRVTYDIAAALKTGHVNEEQVAPWRRIGKESERWTVSALDGSAAPVSVEDFGDEPPF